jgi:hypothetical protein
MKLKSELDMVYKRKQTLESQYNEAVTKAKQIVFELETSQKEISQSLALEDLWERKILLALAKNSNPNWRNVEHVSNDSFTSSGNEGVDVSTVPKQAEKKQSDCIRTYSKQPAGVENCQQSTIINAANIGHTNSRVEGAVNDSVSKQETVAKQVKSIKKVLHPCKTANGQRPVIIIDATNGKLLLQIFYVGFNIVTSIHH